MVWKKTWWPRWQLFFVLVNLGRGVGIKPVILLLTASWWEFWTSSIPMGEDFAEEIVAPTWSYTLPRWKLPLLTASIDAHAAGSQSTWGHHRVRAQSSILSCKLLQRGIDPCTNMWLTLISAWISNVMLGKVWDEITYPFPNFNGCTFEVWEWISNFIPHFIMM